MAPPSLACVSALVAVAAALFGCGGELVLDAPTDRAPVSAIVIELLDTPRLRALEPVPTAIPVELGVEVHVLLYDDPLERLNVDLVHGELVPTSAAPSDATPFASSTALPPPDVWLSGGAGADRLTEVPLAEVPVGLRALRVMRPPCPRYTIDAVVTAPALLPMSRAIALSEDALLLYFVNEFFWVDTSTARPVGFAGGRFDNSYVRMGRVDERRVLVASATVARRQTVHVWALVDTNGRFSPVSVDPDVRHPAMMASHRFADGWHLASISDGHLDEIDADRGTSREITAVSGSSCNFIDLTEDERILVASSAGVSSLPLSGEGELEPYLSTEDCIWTIGKTAQVEAAMDSTGVVSWRPNDQRAWRRWRDPTIDVEGLLVHGGQLYASTADGPGLLRLGRAPQLCAVPVVQGAGQALLSTGGHLVEVPRGALFEGRPVAWVREVQ